VTDLPETPLHLKAKAVAYGDCMVLQWTAAKYKKTIKLDCCNLGTMYTVPGYSKFAAYYTAVKMHECHEKKVMHGCFEATNITEQGEISDKFDLLINPNEGNEEKWSKVDVRQLTDNLRKEGLIANFYENPFNDTQQTTAGINETYKNIKSDEDLLMVIHQQLSHIFFQRIIRMAENGVLPKRLAKCHIPVCQSCIYGKLTRKAWRTKGTSNTRKLKLATQAGEVVSVDQLESPVDGLIAQVKGTLFQNKRYKCATIFVDHFSDLSYVHLQESTAAKETIQAKESFESYARSHGVVIKQYHADNGRFAEKAWRNDVLLKPQSLSFSGVGAHHQNGRAEKRIRDLQDMARTSLLHANRMWPDAVSIHLWPYALRHANESINMTPFPGSTATPIEKFSNVQVSPNYKDIHTFGCPAYVLDKKMQSGFKEGKWKTRARVAVYLGNSPQHARSVGLVLSLTTGLASPQYHVKYDETFETVRSPGTAKSLWQYLSGIDKYEDSAGRDNMEIVLAPPGHVELPVSTHLGIDETYLGKEDEQQITGEQEELEHEHSTENVSASESNEDEGSVSKNEGAPNMQEGSNQRVRDNADARQTGTTRSGRAVRVPSRFNDYIALSLGCSDQPDFDEPKLHAFTTNTSTE
jgi:hypothetical protein